MKQKLMICLLILGMSAGCGKVPTLSNGEEAVVSFDKTDVGISASTLYSEIKNSALGNLIEMIDTKILLDKYPDTFVINPDSSAIFIIPNHKHNKGIIFKIISITLLPADNKVSFIISILPVRKL